MTGLCLIELQISARRGIHYYAVFALLAAQSCVVRPLGRPRRQTATDDERDCRHVHPEPIRAEGSQTEGS